MEEWDYDDPKTIKEQLVECILILPLLLVFCFVIWSMFESL